MTDLRIEEQLGLARAILARDPYSRPVSPQEQEWAARSPAYRLGDRVLAYTDVEPGSILCRDTRYPGHWFVLMDRPSSATRAFMAVAWDNLTAEGPTKNPTQVSAKV